MKVKNIENLRKELRRNLDQLYFGNGYVDSALYLSCGVMDDEYTACHRLDNPIYINKYKDSNYKLGEDTVDELFITVDAKAIHFWKVDYKHRCFELEDVMLYSHHSNKSELMMHITLYITKFLYK